MDYIVSGIKEGLELIFSLDREILEISLLSITVSGMATIIASAINVPLFVYLGLLKLPGEKIISRLLNAFMSVPTILVGLVVALVLARRGPFGALQLMYTPAAMIIAQAILISPLIAALTYDRCKKMGRTYEKLGKTLGANRWQRCLLVISQLKQDVLIVIATAFARAISEVGVVMMVGGNIKGKTRVMTTAMALHNSTGNYSQAIALGIVLLTIAVIINLFIHILSPGD